MLFTITFLHNITRHDGRLAVLTRLTDNRLLPGDTLQVVGILALPAHTLTDAAERAFAVANGAGPDRLAETYRSWGVRSMCIGDALAIDAHGRRRHLLACTTADWRPVPDPRPYTILPGHRPTTDTSDATSSAGACADTDSSDTARTDASRPPDHGPGPANHSNGNKGIGEGSEQS